MYGRRQRAFLRDFHCVFSYSVNDWLKQLAKGRDGYSGLKIKKKNEWNDVGDLIKVKNGEKCLRWMSTCGTAAGGSVKTKRQLIVLKVCDCSLRNLLCRNAYLSLTCTIIDNSSNCSSWAI